MYAPEYFYDAISNIDPLFHEIPESTRFEDFHCTVTYLTIICQPRRFIHYNRPIWLNLYFWTGKREGGNCGPSINYNFSKSHSDWGRGDEASSWQTLIRDVLICLSNIG